MELITRTARLVPYAKRPKQMPSFVAALVLEPAPDDPASSLGNLFIIIEVLVSGRPGEDVGNTIISTFENVYYDDGSLAITILDRFEAATKATNAALAELVNQGNASWIGKLSAIIAVAAESELHLTHSGSAEAYLYRNQANTRITAGSGNRPSGPSKTFGLVASGQLEAGDHILMATPALVHQVSLPKLHDIVAATNPNSAIAELTKILKGTDGSRIAALISEITTPELAALQVRSDHPDELSIGAPETPLEAAKQIATPLAEATIATSLRAGKVAKAGWEQARPKLQSASQMAAKVSKTMLSGQRIARRALIGLSILILSVSLTAWYETVQHANKKLLSSYEQVFKDYTAADSINEANAKRSALNAVQGELKNLSPQSLTIDKLITKANLEAGTPKTIEKLGQLITYDLDLLDGLHNVTATNLVDFNRYKDAAPGFIETSNGNIYSVNAQTGQVYVVDLATKSVIKPTTNFSKVGKVVATTLSSNNDGIYILTSQPTVWFFRFQGTSLTQISLGLSGWESGTSISSYAGNLYVLANGQIEKHVRTSTGFSPGTSYISGTSTVPNPTALAVDGYAYLSGTDGLYQYLSGSPKTSVTARSGLTDITNLRSTSNDQLVGSDSSSGHIGVWSDHAALTFVSQYQLTNMKSLTDAVYDPITKTFFALADNELVSFLPIQ
jgi:hypothetical protein